MAKLKVGRALGQVLALKSTSDDGTWILDAMDKADEKPYKDKREGGWIHASALDYPCDRCVGYIYAGVKVQEFRTAQQIRTYECGLNVEASMIKKLKKAKILVRAGKQHENAELHIRYTIDAVTRHPEFGYERILEIKTAQTVNTWAKYKLHPNPDHVKRTNLYMALEEIPRATIIYQQAFWPHERKAHVLELDKEMWESQKERIRRIVKFVDANEPPPQMEQIFGGCSNSPFFELCAHAVPPHDAPRLIKGISL